MSSQLLATATCLVLLCAAARGQNDEINLTPPPKVQPVVRPVTEVDPPSTSDTPSDDVDPLMAEVKRLLEAEDSQGTPAVEGATTAPSAATATSPEATTESPRSVSSVLLQGTMALLGTVALILLLLAVVKRWGKRSPLLAGHTLGQVMGRIALSPQASLHFVRIQDEILVVGVTQQHVNLIQTLDANAFESDVEPAPASETVGAGPADFLSQLRSSQATLSESPTAMDEELNGLKGDLERLQQYFQDSTRARE